MLLTAARRANPLLLFVTSLALVYTVAVLVVSRLAALDRAHLVAAGVTLDLVVVVPALWYLLVVRRRHWPWISVAPVFLLSLFAASVVIPEAHRGTLRALELLAVPIEIGVLAYVGVRVARAARRARLRGRAAADPIGVLEAAALELLRSPAAARVAASELAMLYYGLCTWRRAPERGPSVFSVDQRSVYGSVIAGLFILAAAELFPVHVLLSRWSPAAAWVATGLSLYGVLWLIADWRATRLRPIRLSATGLELRHGLRWTVRIPLEDIESIETPRETGPEAPRPLRLAPFDDPDLIVRLRGPVRVQGLYGMMRETACIAIPVDEPGRLLETWAGLVATGAAGLEAAASEGPRHG